jgi:hypothetical protein
MQRNEKHNEENSLANDCQYKMVRDQHSYIAKLPKNFLAAFDIYIYIAFVLVALLNNAMSAATTLIGAFVKIYEKSAMTEVLQ